MSFQIIPSIYHFHELNHNLKLEEALELYNTDIYRDNIYKGCKRGDFMKNDAQMSIIEIDNYLMTHQIE